MDDIQKLRIHYGALNGLLDTLLMSQEDILSQSILKDYEHIFRKIDELVEIDISHLKSDTVEVGSYRAAQGSEVKFETILLISKCKQLRGILDTGYNVADKIIEIGSLFNAIKDEELRSRCADLLTAPDHFDRVVNQATQVLENRIKLKSGSSKSGKALIGEVIKSDLGKTKLILSNNLNEQEGYLSICLLYTSDAADE